MKINDNQHEENLYNILEINTNASINEIKKAYRKLSLKYHPDKQINSILTNEEKNEKFIKLRNAYEILSDENKRETYDKKIQKNKTNINDINNFIDNIKKIFTNIYYEDLIKIIDNKLKQSIDNFNFDEYLIYIKKINLIDIIESIKNFQILDIEININFTLKEFYNNSYRKINYNRITKNTFVEIIFPIDKTQIYTNEGEIIKINNKIYEGNFIIQINIIEKNYKNIKYQFLNNDIYAFIYNANIVNNIISFIYLDDVLYHFNIDKLEKINTDFGSLFYLQHLGLPYYNTLANIIDINECNILRGNLYLFIL
jgi:curved DNA-binding protein CbpA